MPTMDSDILPFMRQGVACQYPSFPVSAGSAGLSECQSIALLKTVARTSDQSQVKVKVKLKLQHVQRFWRHT